MSKQEQVRRRIEDAASGINNAVCWDDPEWNDDNGKSIMDRLVEDIDAIYGVRADDDELVTKEWLGSICTDCKDYNHCFKLPCGKTLDIDSWQDNWRVFVWDGDKYMKIGELMTRRQFRNLCEALGVELKEVQGG